MPTTKHILESLLHDVEAMKREDPELNALYVKGYDNAVASVKRRIQRALARLETSEGR